MDIEKLKFPIGEYVIDKNPSKSTIESWIKDIETFPSSLEKEITHISKDALNWKYRPNGWTVKQVIHHCADSHINSYIRFKLAITEETPTIKPYFEDKWAELLDAKDNDVSYSLSILKGLHYRWAKMLRSLTKEQLKRTFYHPENKSKINLAENIGLYAWHCNHHLAHIKNGLKSNNKYK